jgi:hypothetical protein
VRTIRIAVLSLATLLAAVSPVAAQDEAPKRPALLMPLYAGHIALQGADLHSTFSALDHGLVEGNPLLRDGNRAKMIGAKLAASTTAIFITEKLWKKNRVAAISVMLVSNTALSLVVANNYRLKAAR